ncbi:hypothetical protein ABB30_08665 [Stenotrophomonas ginsengisoli]|uniref:Orotate phosphoribosyltransferase n=1 Tax=Stenotrophomonas ginsengisoli TaxID=336566 RepID=A0A0R0D3T5_9GAMM|nr:DUF4870 domain-containing protein [Stenotrophomonas ginsengisoli]KRG76781.1 hypothetical protein ABB30_08665 [Stenotrophomonas ginsengisoli]
MTSYENQTPPPPTNSGDDNSLALLVHLSGIILGFIVPLIVWLVNKDNPNKAFLNDQSKEALNFHINVIVASIVLSIIGGILTAVTFGLGAFVFIPLMVVFGIAVAVFLIIAGLAAQKGEYYRYPFIIRLIK